MAVQAAEEITNGTGANIICRCVSLRLDINPVEAKGVLVNYPVNAIVTGPSKCAACFIGACAAVTHADKEIDYQAFKKFRWGGANTVKNIAGKSGIYLAVCSAHNFIWCVCLTARRYVFVIRRYCRMPTNVQVDWTILARFISNLQSWRPADRARLLKGRLRRI